MKICKIITLVFLFSNAFILFAQNKVKLGDNKVINHPNKLDEIKVKTQNKPVKSNLEQIKFATQKKPLKFCAGEHEWPPYYYKKRVISDAKYKSQGKVVRKEENTGYSISLFKEVFLKNDNFYQNPRQYHHFPEFLSQMQWKQVPHAGRKSSCDKHRLAGLNFLGFLYTPGYPDGHID